MRIIWMEWEVELSAISIAVIGKAMFLKDRSLWWHADGEEKWSKHWALRNSRSKKMYLRDLTPGRHPEWPTGEVKLEPLEWDDSLHKGWQEDLVASRIKSSRQIQPDEYWVFGNCSCQSQPDCWAESCTVWETESWLNTSLKCIYN